MTNDEEAINSVELAARTLVDSTCDEMWQVESQVLRNQLLCFNAAARLMLFEIRMFKNAFSQVNDTIEY